MNRRLIACAASLACLCSLPATAGAQKAPSPAAPAARTELVNLNTASAAQLAALPGIGPKTAERIIEHRQKTGGFRKIEELMNVRGVGEKLFLKLRSLITVTTPKPEPAGAGIRG